MSYRYSNDELQPIKDKVLEFVKKQPGYSNQQLSVMWLSEDGVYIQYGLDPVLGVAGFGETPEEAYQQFMEVWNRSKGEQGILKNYTYG